MKQSQFTKRQIISALKEYKQRGKVVEISGQRGYPFFFIG